MDYKEKYEQALERASKLRVQNPFDTVGQMVEHIFPDLQESEDEKIRKEIISFLKDFEKDHYRSVNFNSWIAWLEKQKLNTSKREIDDAYLQGICDAKHAIEKQGEQTTDKIKTKFKEGDYIVPYNVTPLEIWKVINIDKDGYYKIQSITDPDDYEIYRVPAFILEEDYRLWLINDAKDGDVLLEEETGEPFIYNGNRAIYFSGYFLGAYCGIYNGEFNPYGNIHYWGKNSCPATKEQRELFFKEIHDAGYVWDSEKKEVKKIEL